MWERPTRTEPREHCLDRAAIFENSRKKAERKQAFAITYLMSPVAPKKLGFAPFQLAAKDLEIGLLGRLDQFQALRGTSDTDAIIRLHGDTFLAVEG